MLLTPSQKITKIQNSISNPFVFLFQSNFPVGVGRLI